MSDDEDRKDADIIPLFIQQPRHSEDAKGFTPGGYCPHLQKLVDRTSRTVTCDRCDALLDPFDVLMAIANDKRSQLAWAKEERELRKRLMELREEERKIKQRTRAASRKDSAKAVADAVEHWKQKYRRVVYRLREIEMSAASCRRQLGDDGPPNALELVEGSDAG